jgi:hypothetical protein
MILQYIYKSTILQPLNSNNAYFFLQFLLSLVYWSVGMTQPLTHARTHTHNMWSSGQSSWLQIQSSGFDSRRYQIFWEAMRLERGPLSLVSTTEELLGRKSSGFGLEIRQYGSRDPSRWPRDTLYPQKVVLTSLTNDGRSVGIVRSRTQATGFFLYISTKNLSERKRPPERKADNLTAICESIV